MRVKCRKLPKDTVTVKITDICSPKFPPMITENLCVSRSYCASACAHRTTRTSGWHLRIAPHTSNCSCNLTSHSCIQRTATGFASCPSTCERRWRIPGEELPPLPPPTSRDVVRSQTITWNSNATYWQESVTLWCAFIVRLVLILKVGAFWNALNLGWNKWGLSNFAWAHKRGLLLHSCGFLLSTCSKRNVVLSADRKTRADTG